jgi:hypothetical protein
MSAPSEALKPKMEPIVDAETFYHNPQEEKTIFSKYWFNQAHIEAV